MQQINDYVETDYFQHAAPRPLTATLLITMFGERVFERPFGTLLHPLFVTSLAILVVLVALRSPTLLLVLPLCLVVGMLMLATYRTSRQVWADLRLLRHGLLLRAHVMKLRPHRTVSGDLDGALLDCAIVVAPRRTYVGSIWIADGNEALRLLRQSRLQIICLPHTPGTWRVIEPIHSAVRYDRVGPAVAIPADA